MLNKFGFFAHAYTRKGLFQLFMVCAFPIHIWAIFAAFRDFSWVAERTNVWDAIGLLSYAVAFALVETIGIFFIVALLGLLVPSRWDSDTRLALIGNLFLTVAIWSILGQVYSLLGYPLPKWGIDFLVNADHPLRILWGTVFLPLVISAIVPTVLVIRSGRVKGMVIETFDRISLLSSVYVFFDLVGIVIIAIRNVRT